MEIKARSVYDLETMTAFSHYMIYKKREPKKFFTVSVAFTAGVAMAAAIEMVVFGFDFAMMMAIVLLAVLGGLSAFMYFALPKLQYRSLAKMRDAENDFVFGDTEITVKTVGDGIEGESRLCYDNVFKAAETSRYFFIYQSKVHLLVVDKSTAEDGGAEAISEKLKKTLGDRYVRCKY